MGDQASGSDQASREQHAATVGQFNYLAGEVGSSLLRNGKVLTKRDADGSDGGSIGVDFSGCGLPVEDARTFTGNNARTVARHGFELIDRPMENLQLDFHDHQQVISQYYPDCIRTVADSTGAAHVFAFDHNIRSATGKKDKKRITGGQQVQGPAHVVHGDYTLTSAPQRLRDLSKPPGKNDTLNSILAAGEALIDPALVEEVIGNGRRFAIVNVWRNIVPEPVAVHPLALCDSQTVQPEDLVVFEIHYADRIGENYFAKHADRHRWYYYPAMTREEALLIKQWDSEGEMAKTAGARADNNSGTDHLAPCTFSFHSAFKDPSVPDDAPDRWSIEVRCMVVY